MGSTNETFNRVIRLTGNDAFKHLAEAKVIIFGIGGVGSWCAESLVRSGIHHLTIVDADIVAQSNINRQLPATTSNLGQPKVDAMRRRLLDINPEADITALNTLFTDATAPQFHLDNYDCIIDAIDSLTDKASLILHATATKAKFFSSMGAALKIDPTRVGVTEFWKVKGCPLAASLRHKFKKSGIYPKKKFQCVYSDEQPLKNHPDATADKSGAMTFNKAAINGAVCHITAIFGLQLAALTFNYLIKQAKKLSEPVAQ